MTGNFNLWIDMKIIALQEKTCIIIIIIITYN
jgi:hypothetical protein